MPTRLAPESWTVANSVLIGYSKLSRKCMGKTTPQLCHGTLYTEENHPSTVDYSTVTR